MKTLQQLSKDFLSIFAQEVQQFGTTELFFDSAANQQKYSNAIQNGAGQVAKLLMAYSTKTSKPSKFSLSIQADPKVGAQWILQVEPVNLKNTVFALLDTDYRKLMNEGMLDRLKKVMNSAKNGSGSGGPLLVGSLDIE